jgi:oligopeptide transport system substrate-binding protein
MVAPSELDRLRVDPELSKQLRIVPKLTTNFLGFNLSKAPTDNRMLRKALSAAIDRQAMVDNVLKGEEIPARTFTAPGVFGSPAENPSFRGITYDPDQAREWLAEAGYPGGESFPELTLWFTHTSAGGNPFPRLIPFIQQQWKEMLGIEVKLASQEWAMYLQTINVDPPPLWSVGWRASFPDAHCTLVWPFHPTKGMDKVRWAADDPAALRFVAAVDAAAVESDPDVRAALYFEAESILCEEQAAVVPLYHETARWLTKPYVERTYGPDLNLYRWKVNPH